MLRQQLKTVIHTLPDTPQFTVAILPLFCRGVAVPQPCDADTFLLTAFLCSPPQRIVAIFPLLASPVYQPRQTVMAVPPEPHHRRPMLLPGYTLRGHPPRIVISSLLHPLMLITCKTSRFTSLCLRHTMIVMFRGTHLHRNFHAISIPVFV